MAAVSLILLAGPIVRRVEPRLASVWVALDRPRAVKLALYEGLQKSPVTAQPLAVGAVNTVGVGASLHLALVVIELKDPAPPLNPGVNYAYNLLFYPFQGTAQGAVLNAASLTGPTDDLFSL